MCATLNGVVFIVGWEGTILSSNGGRFSSLPSPTTEVLCGVCEYNNKMFVVGENGTILQSTNGEPFIAVASPTRDTCKAISVSGECIFIACYHGEIICSKSGGPFDVAYATKLMMWCTHSVGHIANNGECKRHTE